MSDNAVSASRVLFFSLYSTCRRLSTMALRSSAAENPHLVPYREPHGTASLVASQSVRILPVAARLPAPFAPILYLHH